MSWWNLLKQPKLTISPKTFTAYKIPPKKEEGDCNRRLKEIADKLNSREGILFPLQDVSTEYVGQHRTGKGRHHHHLDKWFGRDEKGSTEWVQGDYNPIPEDIACQVLEKMDASDFAYVNFRTDEIDDAFGGKWKMNWDFNRGKIGRDMHHPKRISMNLSVWALDSKKHHPGVGDAISFSHSLKFHKDIESFPPTLVAKWLKEIDWR